MGSEILPTPRIWAMRMRILSELHMRETKTQATLHNCTDSPKPSLHWLSMKTETKFESSFQCDKFQIMRGSRGGERADAQGPLINYKNIGSLPILVRIPWKITKLPCLHSLLRHHRYVSETPCRWRFAGGAMITRL